MSDWSGIDLGGDDMDININFGVPKRQRDNRITVATSSEAAGTSSAPSKNPFSFTKSTKEAKPRVGITKKYAESIEKKKISVLPSSSSSSSSKTLPVKLPPSTSSSSSASVSVSSSKSRESSKTMNMPPPPPPPEVLPDTSERSRSESPPSTTKTKYRHIDRSDDQHQYHAKPAELSRNALKRPRPMLPSSSNIFSQLDFSALELPAKLVAVLEEDQNAGGFGIKTSTHVQSACIPLLQQRRNMLIRSQTGSGKTLAFLLPMLHDLMDISPRLTRGDGTRTLIISPTRELCHQIEEVLSKLITKSCCYIVSGCISGGEKKKSEKARLRKGVVVLVGTPGRLLDHLKVIFF